MKITIPYQSFLWVSLGTLAYCLCFPCWDLFYLSPMILACYLFAMHRIRTPRESLILALIASTMIALGGFHWIVYVAQNFGGLPLPAALAMLFAFCFLAAPQMYVFFYLGHRYKFQVERLPVSLRPVFWGLLYVALEFLARFIKVFPEHLGNTIVHYLPLAQAASLGGVSLLSFLPLFCGASFYYLYKEKLRALPIFLLSVILPITLVHWGKTQIQTQTKLPGKTLRISMLQANIGDLDKVVSEKGNREAIRSVVQRYLDLASQAPPSDLIIWPETAYPINFPARSAQQASAFAIGYANLVMEQAKKLQTSFFLGGYEQENGHDYNSGILIGEKGLALGSYRKVKLLIFGEWMPFSDWFPSLKSLNPQMGDFGIGEGPVPIPWHRAQETIQLGASICYEAIMPEYMHAIAKNGADLFLNITNDSWFGPTLEPWQHLQLAQLRAIENRLPFVRATNTGISVIIDPSGRITKMGSLFQAEILSGELLLAKQKTKSFYLKYGELFAWTSLLLSLLFLAYFWRLKRLSN